MNPPAWTKLRSMAAVLLGGTLLSVAAVLWMGWRLLDQDQALEAQQRRQRLETTADAAAAVLEKTLLQAEQSMTSPGWRPEPGGAILVRVRKNTFEHFPPGILLFSPISIEARPVIDPFAEAERQEFNGTNLSAAEGRYRELTAAKDANLRAGALVRLARVQRKRGDSAGADQTYTQLGLLTGARFENIPVPLIAGLAREDAQALCASLDNPQLLPTQDVFLFHAAKAGALSHGAWKPDTQRLKLSQAIANRWPESDGSGRAVEQSGREPITILWRREGDVIMLLAATMPYVQRQWTTRATEVAAQAGAQLLLQQSSNTSPNTDAVTRSASSTGLPWTISVQGMREEESTILSGRRRLIATGTLSLSLLLLLTGYLTHRAVNREIAAARMQSEFVAAVSHEFRTPLTALRQFTDMLLERSSLSDAQRRTCYEAQARSTERLSRLVESLLDFRRMEAGARPYVMEEIDLVPLVRQVASEFRRECGIEIHVAAPSAALVQADSSAVSLAIWNLLDNAAKYAPGTPIDISLRRDEGAVHITVADKGPGIPASEQQRIFEKFVRGGDAERLRVKGTGIGLSMVKHIIDAHHGRIELNSRVGAGSAFTIQLPGENT